MSITNRTFIKPEAFYTAVLAWNQNPGEQRLGQYLMNTFHEDIKFGGLMLPNPDVFYTQEDQRIVTQKFVSEYVEGGARWLEQLNS